MAALAPFLVSTKVIHLIKDVFILSYHSNLFSIDDVLLRFG